MIDDCSGLLESLQATVLMWKLNFNKKWWYLYSLNLAHIGGGGFVVHAELWSFKYLISSYLKAKASELPAKNTAIVRIKNNPTIDFLMLQN